MSSPRLFVKLSTKLMMQNYRHGQFLFVTQMACKEAFDKLDNLNNSSPRRYWLRGEPQKVPGSQNPDVVLWGLQSL